MNKILMSLFLFCFCAMTLSAKHLFLVSSDHAPYQYKENGKAVGINIDILTEAFKRMNSSFTFEFKPWQTALFMTKYAHADAIMNTSYKKARAKYLFYPKEEVFNHSWYAFTLKTSKISLNEDFSNANQFIVGIMHHFTYGGKIQKAIDNKVFKKIIAFQDNEHMVKALYSHKIDMYIDNKGTVALFHKRFGYENQTRVVKMTGTDKEFLLSFGKTYLAFSKKKLDMDFIRRLSKVLKDMRKDGTIDKMAEKYY